MDTRGRLRLAPARRRFPHFGVVPLVYGIVGSATCAGITWLLVLTRLNPQVLRATSSGPAPSWENILFQAGFVEVFVAMALVGTWLFGLLWGTRIPEGSAGGQSLIHPLLLRKGIILGPPMAVLFQVVSLIGNAVREMSGMPLVLRPLAAAIASPAALFVSSVTAPIIPVVLVGLGLVMGVVTAALVSRLWTAYPADGGGP